MENINNAILCGDFSLQKECKDSDILGKTSETNDKSIFVTDSNEKENISDLRQQFSAVQDEQGFLGKLWNGFKNLTGLGLSSNVVEDEISLYENGELSYNEVLSSVESFKDKQESMVSIIANTFTGLATAGFAIATGGIGAIVGGAFVGALTKAGIKTLDRATNELKGDAFDAKEILKDGASGALDGIVSAATAGMVNVPVAGQAVKESVKQGFIQGARSGAITGAVTGAADYTIETVAEEDKNFSFADLMSVTMQNAISGTVFGGLFGGIGGGISQSRLNEKVKISHNYELNLEVDNAAQASDYIKNYYFNKDVDNVDIEGMTATLEDLSVKSENLSIKFDSQLDEFSNQLSTVFDDKSEIVLITSRAKGQKSIFSKLAKKKLEGFQLKDIDSCYDAISDALGVRIQIKSLDDTQAKDIVEKILNENNISANFDDFVSYINNVDLFDEQTAMAFSAVKNDIIDTLKTEQSQNVVNQLIKAIKKGDIKITTLNNYGSELTSYFTDKQIAQIVDAYDYAVSKNIVSNDKVFEIVSQNKTINDGDIDISNIDVISVMSKNKDGLSIKVKQNTNKAEKISGYASSQINIVNKLSDGSVANGELQIRGDKLNEFAEVEHIPYDIRVGKTGINDKKYSTICGAIKNMSEADYNCYNNYLSDTYKALRLKELGLLSESANLPDIRNYIDSAEVSDELLSALSINGLINLAGSSHK